MKRPRQPYNVQVRRVADRAIQLKYWCPVRQRHVRETTGTYDLREAQELARDLEARLRTETYQYDASMPWERFCEVYDAQELITLAPTSRERANVVLELFTQLVNPATLDDAANADVILRFRQMLITEVSGKTGRPRSIHTVRSYMATLNAIFSWAVQSDFLARAPKLRRLKVPKQLARAKGRPLKAEEFERMLMVVGVVVGKDAAPSWRYTLRGLWNSAMRLEETLDLDWTDREHIHPIWPERGLPYLVVPSSRQKSARDQEIPLLPWLEAVLLETPGEARHGRIFRPRGLGGGCNLTPKWIGRVISRIGARAGVKVSGTKYASAHDLRRSCSERMLEAGVDPRIVQAILRHSSLTTTMAYYSRADRERAAQELWKKLGGGQSKGGHTLGHTSKVQNS